MTRRPPGELPRVALVTGGSGTLGAAVARAFARAGYSIGLVAGSRVGDAHAFAAELQVPSTVVTADVADMGSVTSAVEEVEKRLGPIGVLIAAAAVRQDGLLVAQEPEVWERTIRVNLFGVHHACRAVLPGMLSRRAGRVVAVSSPVARTGNPGQTAYAASKAGVEGLVRSLAAEVAGRHVTVNAVAPGFFRSALTADVDAEALARRQAAGELPPSVEPEQVAAVVLDLAEDTRRNGEVVDVP